MIDVVGTTRIYFNPQPEVFARHAWHPSLVRLGADCWLCSFDIGQAPESRDYVTYVSRSADDGVTWSRPTRMLAAEPEPRATHSIRTARLADGRLLGVGARFVRADANQGLINHPGLGYCDVEIIRTTSDDGGRTWSPVSVVDPPVASPAWETCHAPVSLRDGRVLFPTSTWLGWDGGGPGMRALAFVSFDGGFTWPTHVEEFDRWGEGIVSWEQSIAELPDGRLVAVVWSLDTATGVTLPTVYKIAAADGVFGPPLETGISAQTMKIAALADGRLLAVYRRHDEPGLWATVARADDEWTSFESVPLWRGAMSGMAGASSVGAELSALQFGCPSIVVCDDDTAAVAFWCRENDVTGIRLVRLHLA